MNRREFIEKALAGSVSIAAGASVLASLGIETIKASSRGVFHGNHEIPLRIEDTPELKEVGGVYHLTLDEMDKDLLIVRTGEDAFLAVDIKCTHKGCEVKYEPKSNMFECPCHDSRFDINGVPKSGPAKRPLGVYKTSFKDGEVTVYIPEVGEAITPAVIKSDSVKVDTTVRK